MYKFLGFLMVGASLIGSGLATALPLPTGQTNMPAVGPLIVTSVGMSDGLRGVDFVEVYNTGKVPVQLADWQIVAVANDGEHTMQLAEKPGYIEPATHVVVASGDVVSSPTYVSNGWDSPVGGDITAVELRSDEYRPHVVAITAKFANLWMMRKYNTTSYSDAASAFDIPWRGLFDDGLYVAPVTAGGLGIVEIYPYASNCNPLETDVLCRDYVKIMNMGVTVMNLDNYVLRTDSSSQNRTAANTIALSGDLYPGEYLTISLTNAGQPLSLMNSGGYVWLEDTWGLAQYGATMTYYESATSLMQGRAYALTDSGEWQWTTTPSPYRPNVITAISSAKVCPEGSLINPATNRCNKIPVATELTPCKEGQERNPDTNRCRSVLGAADTRKPCKDTQYRSEETGRCRNLPASDVPGAAFAVKPVEELSTKFVGWWALGGVVLLACGYGVYEWRSEILAGVRKLFRR